MKKSSFSINCYCLPVCILYVFDEEHFTARKSKILNMYLNSKRVDGYLAWCFQNTLNNF